MGTRTPITVPQLGAVEAILIVEWLGTAGEQVAAGDAVVVIETEKAETEIEAPASGKLEIDIEAGDDEHAVGTVLGHIIED